MTFQLLFFSLFLKGLIVMSLLVVFQLMHYGFEKESPLFLSSYCCFHDRNWKISLGQLGAAIEGLFSITLSSKLCICRISRFLVWLLSSTFHQSLSLLDYFLPTLHELYLKMSSSSLMLSPNCFFQVNQQTMTALPLTAHLPFFPLQI